MRPRLRRERSARGAGRGRALQLLRVRRDQREPRLPESRTLKVAILGTGSALPEKRVTNADLESRIDTSDEWIRTRTGIRERRVLRPGESLLDLMEGASRRALEAASLAPAALDAILVGTVSPEYSFPAAACQLQERLGLDRIPAFDLAAACSGFIYGLSTASAHLRAGDFRTVLLVGADALTTMVDWRDRRTCVLFGDGAGAAVLARREGEGGVRAAVTRASGSLWQLLYAGIGPRGGYGAEVEPPAEATIHMKGPELFRVAVRLMEEAIREVLDRIGAGPEKIDLVIPHQANVRIVNAVAERLGVLPEKVFVNLDRLGNTSAASVPIALDEAVRAERIRPGDLVVFAACGGGLTWGAAAVEW